MLFYLRITEEAEGCHHWQERVLALAYSLRGPLEEGGSGGFAMERLVSLALEERLHSRVGAVGPRRPESDSGVWADHWGEWLRRRGEQPFQAVLALQAGRFALESQLAAPPAEGNHSFRHFV